MRARDGMDVSQLVLRSGFLSLMTGASLTAKHASRGGPDDGADGG